MNKAFVITKFEDDMMNMEVTTDENKVLSLMKERTLDYLAQELNPDETRAWSDLIPKATMESVKTILEAEELPKNAFGFYARMVIEPEMVESLKYNIDNEGFTFNHIAWDNNKVNAILIKALEFEEIR